MSKTCCVCKEPLYDGMYDPGAWFGRDGGFIHEDCFRQYMDTTFGEGKWRPVDDDGEDGFYEHLREDGTWDGTGIYYSDWSDDYD